MGLDISHKKATLQKPITTDPYGLGGITEESFDGFDVEFSHFQKFIQKIDCTKVIKTAIIVDNYEYLDYTKDWFKERNLNIFFEWTEDSLKKELKDFEIKNNLKNLSSHLDRSPLKWNLLHYYEITKKIGFYSTDVGYQSMGWALDWYFHQPDKWNFVLLEEFERAYNCIDDSKESLTEADYITRRKYFKENFLDNYEFGASILSVID